MSTEQPSLETSVSETPTKEKSQKRFDATSNIQNKIKTALIPLLVLLYSYGCNDDTIHGSSKTVDTDIATDLINDFDTSVDIHDISIDSIVDSNIDTIIGDTQVANIDSSDLVDTSDSDTNADIIEDPTINMLRNDINWQCFNYKLELIEDGLSTIDQEFGNSRIEIKYVDPYSDGNPYSQYIERQYDDSQWSTLNYNTDIKNNITEIPMASWEICFIDDSNSEPVSIEHILVDFDGWFEGQARYSFSEYDWEDIYKNLSPMENWDVYQGNNFNIETNECKRVDFYLTPSSIYLENFYPELQEIITSNPDVPVWYGDCYSVKHVNGLHTIFKPSDDKVNVSYHSQDETVIASDFFSPIATVKIATEHNSKADVGPIDLSIDFNQISEPLNLTIRSLLYRNDQFADISSKTIIVNSGDHIKWNYVVPMESDETMNITVSIDGPVPDDLEYIDHKINSIGGNNVDIIDQDYEYFPFNGPYDGSTIYFDHSERDDVVLFEDTYENIWNINTENPIYAWEGMMDTCYNGQCPIFSTKFRIDNYDNNQNPPYDVQTINLEVNWSSNMQMPATAEIISQQDNTTLFTLNTILEPGMNFLNLEPNLQVSPWEEYVVRIMANEELPDSLSVPLDQYTVTIVDTQIKSYNFSRLSAYFAGPENPGEDWQLWGYQDLPYSYQPVLLKSPEVWVTGQSSQFPQTILANSGEQELTRFSVEAPYAGIHLCGLSTEHHTNKPSKIGDVIALHNNNTPYVNILADSGWDISNANFEISLENDCVEVKPGENCEFYVIAGHSPNSSFGVTDPGFPLNLTLTDMEIYPEVGTNNNYLTRLEGQRLTDIYSGYNVSTGEGIPLLDNPVPGRTIIIVPNQ